MTLPVLRKLSTHLDEVGEQQGQKVGFKHFHILQWFLSSALFVLGDTGSVWRLVVTMGARDKRWEDAAGIQCLEARGFVNTVGCGVLFY